MKNEISKNEKYKLLLDESGNFGNKDERYIIIGGVLFKETDQCELEKIFRPLHKHVCETFECEEMHGSKNKKIYDYIVPMLGSLDIIHSVIFVIDKEKSYIFDKYDKKSFKYNKAIEHLIHKLLDDGLINVNDELYIKIDNIDLSEYEEKNLKYYLPSKFPFVKKVEQEDSRRNICLQLADIITNRFSKKTKCKADSIELKLLKPKIYCFLKETMEDYLK